MSKNKEKRELSKALLGKYEMVGVEPGEIMYGPRRQVIDTRKCTAKQAEEAVKAGSRYIRKVEKKTSSGSNGKN